MRHKECGYRLRDNIHFHMYISTSPCGDGRLNSPYEITSDRKTPGLYWIWFYNNGFTYIMQSIIVHQVYRGIIFSGGYSESHCSGLFFSTHCQEAGILFMSHPFYRLFQPRCADWMTFYCSPTENKLYINLYGFPSICLVAYAF